MNVRSLCFPALALAFACCLAGGCSGQSESRENLVPVTGTVTMDGKPLEGASVTFASTGTSGAPGGTGVTGADGKYEITHFRAGKGVDPGDYSVMISKMTMPDGKPIPEGMTAADSGAMESVPARFNQTTTLKASVAAGESKSFDFDLKSK